MQVNFKGFPGTTGVREHDALIADRIVTPPDLAGGYVEKLVLLPHSYHYNGHDGLYAHMYHGGAKGAGWPSRQDLIEGKFMMPTQKGGRPVETLSAAAAGRLLLCNFNQFYKIIPAIWQRWMRLLAELPQASLWLLSWSEAGKTSLQRHAAAAQNVAAGEQLLFTTFVEERWHSAAKGVCDLFVDNYPYSSHGTAADALFAGVPIVTVPSESMASRVATSLSLAAGTGPALITRNLDDYFAVALAAARSGGAGLARLRGSVDVMASPAFDSRRWGSTYVQGIKMLWDTFISRQDTFISRQDSSRDGRPLSHVVVMERQSEREHTRARAHGAAQPHRPSSTAPSSRGSGPVGGAERMPSSTGSISVSRQRGQRSAM